MASESPRATASRVSASGRPIALFISLLGLGSGLYLAASHPLAPWFASSAFLGLAWLFFRNTWLGLLALPALMPVLNFSPWTGWLVVEEFDLLVLAVVSAGYLRIWADDSTLHYPARLVGCLAVCTILIGRGLTGPEADPLSLFSGQLSPLNSLRVGKSLLWLALLYPLMARVAESMSRVEWMTGFFRAVLLGSGWVVLGVLWERALHPGLLDISTPYRTVGLFWEMHHGGAALDAYLVLLAPLLAWAWRTTRSFAWRVLLGLYVPVFGYVCLTTFSRGLVVAIGGALIVQWALARWSARNGMLPKHRLRGASVVILTVLVAELVLAFGSGSFMNDRLLESGRDFGGRLDHWERGIRQLETPADWIFGLGLGRLPSRWSGEGRALALPGRFEMNEVNDGSGLRLFGPDHHDDARVSGRFFALSQRVDTDLSARHRLSITARSDQRASVLVRLCAVHLLYPARCRERTLTVSPGGWQTISLELIGMRIAGAEWLRNGRSVFLLSVLNSGAMVEIRDIHLGSSGRNLLRNRQFNSDDGQWFPQSFRYFLPWHVDNFYLELLLETGVAGLLAFLALIVGLMRQILHRYRQGETFSIELLSALSGLMALGLLVSIIDMPRIALLSGLYLTWGALPAASASNDMSGTTDE